MVHALLSPRSQELIPSIWWQGVQEEAHITSYGNRRVYLDPRESQERKYRRDAVPIEQEYPRVARG